jgi:hypothetical protein
MVRGYCRHRDYLAPLKGMGLVDKVIWLEGRGAETLEWCLSSFRGRPGKLLVAPDLRVFGQAKRDIAAMMARLERARIRVVDIIHPQDETVSEMLQRAFVAISGSRFRDKRTARRRGRSGGIGRGLAAAGKRAEIAADWVIRNIVSDPAITWAQAVAIFDGKISEATLRRHYWGRA